MARYKPDSVVSYRLEEPIRDPAWKNFIIGTPEWLTASFSEEYLARQAAVIHPVQQKDDCQQVARMLERSELLYVDTESSGDRPLDGLDALSPSSRVLLFQLGGRAVSKTGESALRTFVIEPKLIPEFRRLMEGDQWLKVLQNAVHDFRFVRAKYGVTFVNIHCTMLAEQMLHAGEEGVNVGLADLVRRYPPNRIISKNVREEFIRHSGVFTGQQIFYAVRDIYLLEPVYRAQDLLIKEQQMERVLAVENRNIPVTAEMGLYGVFLDIPKLRETLLYHLAKRAQWEAHAFAVFNEELQKQKRHKVDLIGIREETFNISSPAAKKDAFNHIGIELEDTEVDTLQQLDHPLAKALIKWSGHNKIVTTYGEKMIEKIHFHTGRFHPQFDQLGAGENAQASGRDKKETIATGRYSSDFQQLPRPEKILEPLSAGEEAEVRRVFAARLAELEVHETAA